MSLSASSPIPWLLRQRRNWRFRSMLSAVRTWPGMSVLDVGCGINGRSFSDQADPSWRITGVDVHEPARIRHRHPGFVYRQANAGDLSVFGAKSFDLVVSIGMLEHITAEAEYRRVCSELWRVGQQYLVVVPYKWAWIEPHYAFPFFGALPHAIQVALIRALNLSGHGKRIEYFDASIRWRTNSEYRAAFPGSRIRLLPLLDTIAIVGC